MADLLASSEGGELLAAILLVVDLAGHVLQVLHTSQWSWSRSDSAASEETKEGTINTRISRRVTIVTWCHNCDAVCHNCDILFVKMLELGSEIIPKN